MSRCHSQLCRLVRAEIAFRRLPPLIFGLLVSRAGIAMVSPSNQEEAMDIKGKAAIVTGSSSTGIGGETAKLLAQRGCNVVVNYATNEAGAAEVVAACKAAGVDAIAVQASVAKDEDCKRLVAARSSVSGGSTCSSTMPRRPRRSRTSGSICSMPPNSNAFSRSM